MYLQHCDLHGEFSLTSHHLLLLMLNTLKLLLQLPVGLVHEKETRKHDHKEHDEDHFKGKPNLLLIEDDRLEVHAEGHKLTASLLKAAEKNKGLKEFGNTHDLGFGHVVLLHLDCRSGPGGCTKTSKHKGDGFPRALSRCQQC
jgi:hypothetical protein